MEQQKSKLRCIDRDRMKYIVLLPMAIGHLIAYMTEYGLIAQPTWWMTLLTSAALAAPPVFLFFVAEGYRYTRSRKQYALRLLLFALVTQIPFCLANHGTLLTLEFFTLWNVIATLFFGLLSLMLWDSRLKLPAKLILLVLLDTVTVLLSFEWMVFGIPIVLGMHIFRDRPKLRLLWFAGLTLCHALIGNGFCLSAAFIEHVSFMMLSYFLVAKCYNGRKGRHPVFAKWFFYIFYPSHLVLIYLLKVWAS